MSTPPPPQGVPQQPQQPPPPYPPQQYQQYPPPGQQTQVYGAPPSMPKKKLGIMIGAIIAIVVVVVVILAVIMMGSQPGNMTATQVLDDYDTTNMNFKSFDAGDTITLRDKIDSISQFGGTAYIVFDYKGENSIWKLSDLTVMVSGDVGECQKDDYITVKATVSSYAGYELTPQALSWEVANTGECGSDMA